MDRLPRATRVAMLAGLEANDIIAGAYTSEGGICPMLAAHRAGGRTSFIDFAEAWDHFAFRDVRRGSIRPRRRRARRATERELLTLRSHLEASLSDDASPDELAAAIVDHQRLRAAARSRLDTETRPDDQRARQRPGDPDRSRELASRGGWRWLPVVRRYDDYQRALALVQPDSAAADELTEAVR